MASKDHNDTPVTTIRSEHLSGVRNSQTVQTALEAAGVEFTNGEQPGVRLRKGRG
jgi:hypothetical protein